AQAERTRHSMARWKHASLSDGIDACSPLHARVAEAAQLCDRRWRARCITKGARRVRRGAPGDGPAQAGDRAGRPLYTGSSWEHGNLEPSAGPAKPGKPPGPAMSRPRGGASVVVRVRESRAHGEGRQ